MGAFNKISEDNMDLFSGDEFFQVIPQLNPSGFNSEDTYEEKFEATKNAIKSQLTEVHCILSTSLGKDSSCLTVVFLEAVRELLAEGVAIKDSYIITVDTLLENPEVHNYAMGEMAKLRNYIIEHNLPIKAYVARPSLSDNYMVNLIGGRILISTPDQGRRKCSMMMKSNPINRLKRRIARELGFKGKQIRDNFVSLTGMRFDESAVRGRRMEARNDRPDHPNKVYKNKKSGDYDLMMSPIAYWSLDDIYMCIGECTSSLRNTYSDLQRMIEIYRSSNGGECLINLQLKGGGSGKTSCSARHGCWSCHSVGQDKSMETMLATEEEYAYMKPLNDLRNLMLAFHYDLSKRNFIARSLNDDGTVRIAPNAYHADYCKDILRWVLTIQIREEEESWRLGIAPRFTILERNHVLGVEYLWNRYAYTNGFAACSIYRDVYVYGERFDMPSIPDNYNKSLPEYPRYDVQFADESFGNFTAGAFDLDNAMTGMDSIDTVQTADQFHIDAESAEFFFEYELDYAIENYSGREINPTSVVHYLIRFGALKIGKGKKHLLEKTLQMANQLWRRGIRDCLNDPDELIRRLTKDKGKLPAKGQQFDIGDFLVGDSPATSHNKAIPLVQL